MPGIYSAAKKIPLAQRHKGLYMGSKHLEIEKLVSGTRTEAISWATEHTPAALKIAINAAVVLSPQTHHVSIGRWCIRLGSFSID